MPSKVDQFRDGIFSLHTNFGELAQLMIAKLEGFKPAKKKYYDLLDKDNNKIEVKFSRAKKKLDSLNASNVIEQCIAATVDSRILLESEATSVTFDCNIQQIKVDEFDFLYYGIFFKDTIVIFKAPKDEVPKMPGYSIQHKDGVEYQFHINKANYKTHSKYFYKKLTYKELYKLFSPKKKRPAR